MDRVVVPLPVRNRTAFVQLSGELDLATMDRARGRVLNTMASEPHPERVVIDLQEVRFLSVSGIGMLLDVAAALAERGIRTQLVVTSSLMRRALRISGATQVLPCYDTAIGALRNTIS
jgi:anti-anti-sigma factor